MFSNYTECTDITPKIWCLGGKKKIRQLDLNLTGKHVNKSLLFPNAHLLLAMKSSTDIYHTDCHE